MSTGELTSMKAQHGSMVMSLDGAGLSGTPVGKVTKSVFSGFVAVKDKFADMTHETRFFMYQAASTLALATEGVGDGNILDPETYDDMGTVTTGLGNTAKNLFGMSLPSIFNKVSVDAKTVGLSASFTGAAMGVATNIPQLASNFEALGGVDGLTGLVQGDFTRALTGLLAVSAYAVQSAYSGFKLTKHRQTLKENKDGDTPKMIVTGDGDNQNLPDLSGRVVSSKLSGVVVTKSPEKKGLIADFVDSVGKKAPGLALKVRACNMIVSGTLTGNVPMIVSGTGFLLGSEERRKADLENSQTNDSSHTLTKVVGDGDTSSGDSQGEGDVSGTTEDETDDLGDTHKVVAPINSL